MNNITLTPEQLALRDQLIAARNHWNQIQGNEVCDWTLCDKKSALILSTLDMVYDAMQTRIREDEKYDSLMKIGKCAANALRDMVAALNCDYGRLEELREAKYCYGNNLCGYMPDNIPDTCETFKEAQAATIEAIEEYRDDDDCTKSLADDYQKAIELCKQQSDCFSVIVDGKCFFVVLNEDDATELVALREAAGECTSQDEAREYIHEDALEVTVRSDWHEVGGNDNEPTEFCILLSTGGPASRIRGELDGETPYRAWLEVQDWGTPWTRYHEDGLQDILLAYAGCFYFGEG